MRFCASITVWSGWPAKVRAQLAVQQMARILVPLRSQSRRVAVDVWNATPIFRLPFAEHVGIARAMPGCRAGRESRYRQGGSVCLEVGAQIRGSLGGPRLLLRRLREVMAKPVAAQVRLDEIVVQIAFNMVAEVCSVYVLHADGRLELYATEGLKREAVHLTTMRIDEGLVGLIAATAEPLALPDAQAHPAFSYKPETGEEIYQSFLGVPILRGGNTLGVLVVQNRARRIYSEEEIEVLQTTAMLLAEMIASGELQSIIPAGADTVLHRSLSLKGSTVAEGVGLGHVVLHEPRVVVKKLVAENAESELTRLDEFGRGTARFDRSTGRSRRPVRAGRAPRRAAHLPHVRA